MSYPQLPQPTGFVPSYVPVYQPLYQQTPTYQDPPPPYRPPLSPYPQSPSGQPFKAEPVQVFNIHIDAPSAPPMDTEEELKITQRAEWLNKKGAWKWETAGKVALIALIILSGASLFALMALPGGLGFGIVMGAAGSLVAVALGLTFAESADWTNYADPETVEKILERAKNSNTPMSRSLINTLEKYGIISKEVHGDLTSQEYASKTATLRGSLYQMNSAGTTLLGSVRQECSEVDNQLYYTSETLPKSKEKQQQRKEIMDQQRDLFAQAQGNVDQAKAYFEKTHGKITQFDPRPIKVVEKQ